MTSLGLHRAMRGSEILVAVSTYFTRQVQYEILQVVDIPAGSVHEPVMPATLQLGDHRYLKGLYMAINPALEWLKRRRTKVVATLGPASNRPEVITELIEAGVNMFRLNMSHGDHTTHAQTVAHIRAQAARTNATISILADLAGPKIRVGQFTAGSIELVEGESVVVTMRDVPGEPGLIPSQYEALAKDVKAGDRILLADGAMELEVVSIKGTEVACLVAQGGVLSDRKGINLPGVDVSAPCLTTKDKADATFLLGQGIDFFGLSFVRRAQDVDELRSLIEAYGATTGIIAKIERPEALEASESIIAAADGLMVARGDLGVELPPEQVPIAQCELIDRTRRQSKPVIVATQMLESMIDNPRPTRAEVSDVAHAVMSGTDAVMLSGETAAGAHPVAAVSMMNRIARQAEAYLWKEGAFEEISNATAPQSEPNFGDAIAHAVAQLSRELGVRAIVTISKGGMSAATMSSARPAAPVLALSPDMASCRRMNLMWGIVPLLVDESALQDGVATARRVALESGLAENGDFILLVRGFAADPRQAAPSITVLRVFA